MREEQAFCVGIAERMFKLPGKQPQKQTQSVVRGQGQSKNLWSPDLCTNLSFYYPLEDVPSRVPQRVLYIFHSKPFYVQCASKTCTVNFSHLCLPTHVLTHMVKACLRFVEQSGISCNNNNFLAILKNVSIPISTPPQPSPRFENEKTVFYMRTNNLRAYKFCRQL